MTTSDSIWEALLAQDNIRRAWRRLERHTATSTHFVDQYEIGEFAADLDSNLASIRRRLAERHWHISPIREALTPKGTGGRNVTPTLREIYWLCPSDQIAWLAVAQVIGPQLDACMPAWSYGHRLVCGPGARNVGSDCPESLFYWGPAHSWPIFQRHVLLTAQMMRDGGFDPSHLGKEEAAVWRAEATRGRRLPYWDRQFPRTRTVRFAALDFKAFGPSIRTDSVAATLTSRCPVCRDDPEFAALVQEMLIFPAESGPPLRSVPMGLVVHGLLTNIAFLPVDHAADEAVRDRAIAHFRFVDDHVVLASDLEALSEWVRTYRGIVAAHLPDLDFNFGKTRPPELEPLLKGQPVPSDTAILDVDAPSRLWVPVPLRPPEREFRAKAQYDELTPPVLDQLAGKPSTESGGWPELELEQDELALAEIAVKRNLRMMRSLPERRSMLRGTLLLFARTGVAGLDQLVQDVVDLAHEDRRVGSATASLIINLYAPLLVASTLRATHPFTPPALRVGAARFVLSAHYLSVLRPGEDAIWAHRRAWKNLGCAARIVLAIHAARVAGLPAASIVRHQAETLDPVSGHEAVTWACWFDGLAPMTAEAVRG